MKKLLLSISILFVTSLCFAQGNGAIGFSNVNPTPVEVIQHDQNLEIKYDIYATNNTQFRMNMPVTLNLDANPKEVHVGQCYNIAGVQSNAGHDFKGSLFTEFVPPAGQYKLVFHVVTSWEVLEEPGDCFDLYAPWDASFTTEVPFTIAGTEISIFPNPASNVLTFQGSYPENATIELINTLGQPVLKARLPQFGEDLSIRHLSAGKYTALIQANGSKLKQQIVIAR